MTEWDYEGYVNRNDKRRCDGVIFTIESFKDQDGSKVPVVWNYEYEKALGHAVLENRVEGVYAFIKFFDDEESQECCRKLRDKQYDISFTANKVVRKDIGHGWDIVQSGCITMVNVYPAEEGFTYAEDEYGEEKEN